MRYMSGVVHSQSLLQILRYACIVAFACSNIAENVDVVEMALLLVLWDESPDNEKRERKNISKR